MMYIRDWDLYLKMMSDPEYLGPIAEDEERFIIRGKGDVTLGYEMPVL